MAPVGRDTLLLIDGHGLVFRAFFAMPALSNSRGEVTNAAFGFTSMLLKAFAEHRPTHAIAAFDPPGPTFRHEEFADYKAHRPDMPSELRPQLAWCREIVAALNIPIVEMVGFEADDVIGALAVQGERAGLDVLIITGDLDTLQLVTDHVHVYASRRGITETIVYDLDKVRERFGFEPPLVVDFKALQGDTSDNIPGVPGIGAKTASALVQQYGPLEAILAAVPTMKEGKVRRLLEEHRAQAELSKRMATIRTELDVPLDADAARLTAYDRAAVADIFERLEFRSLVPRLPTFGDPAGGQAQQLLSLDVPSDRRWSADTVVIADVHQAREAVERLRKGSALCLRTVAPEPARRGDVVGVVLGSADLSQTSYYLPISHDGGDAAADAVAVVSDFLAENAVPLVGYDLKREVLIWGQRGVALSRLGNDLMLGAYLCNTRNRVSNLTTLAHDLCGLRLDAEELFVGSGRSRRDLASIPVAEIAEYYGAWTALLPAVTAQLDRILDRERLRSLLVDLELPLVPILAGMEARGIAVDCEALEVLSAELATRVAAIEAEVHVAAGGPFNLGSTQQLAAFLYDRLGLASGRRTKTGRSTDADTLESLRGENPVVDLILEWRQLTKLKGTYVDALPLLCAADRRIHTSFNQAVATTGRLSSADPNLQNVPVRTEWGRRIRRAFVADDGWQLVSADYSQIELRVLAHVSGEPALIESFRQGEDIHRRTAAQVAGVSPDVVTPAMRRNAKVVNFGVVYGLSDFGLARDTGMSQDDARAFIDAYFARFPRITEYLEGVRNHARQWGWVQTFMGRRRHLPDIHAANRQLRQAAERMAVNMPIQGGAADIMKVAMIRVDAALTRAGVAACQLLQVHDELVIEAPNAEVEQVAEIVRSEMAAAVELIVPLDVDVKVGPNWDAMAPLSSAAIAH